jgi:vancomycin resistance protein VanW
MRSRRAAKVITGSVAGAGFLAGAGAVTFAAFGRPNPGTVPAGVTVAGIEIGGKTVEEARTALTPWAEEADDRPLLVKTPLTSKAGKQWNAPRAKLGASVDLEATLAEAEQVGRSDTAIARLVSLFAGRKAVDIAPKWRVDTAAARRWLETNAARAVKQPVQDARFYAEGPQFRIVPEQPGTELDIPAAIEKIGRLAENPAASELELPVKTVSPKVKAADLDGIKGQVSSYRTHYSERGNRMQNIALACSRINGKVLMPGQIFSYNETVGPRDERAGFKLAPVIIKGKLEPGMGGGICQVSSTLYNAALFADLKIVRRQHHAFPVHYLPAGRDATVVYPAIDFQFQNNTDKPIAISAKGTGGVVEMRIFGVPAPQRQVEIQRTNVSTFGTADREVKDPSLPRGKRVVTERGHIGHRVTVWRIVKENGRLVRREHISSDTYTAFPRCIAVGSGPAAAPPAATGSPGAPASAPAAPTGTDGQPRQ